MTGWAGKDGIADGCQAQDRGRARTCAMALDRERPGMSTAPEMWLEPVMEL